MLVVEDAKALILKLDTPQRVLETIPTAKSVKLSGQEVVLVPHRPEEVRVLRNLGIKAPAPILHYYGWPGNFTPFNHQRMTSAFLTMNHKALVLNEIGTGKTASALWSADYLMTMGLVKKVLIISPLSTLERVWADAIYKDLIHRKAVVLHGTAKRRKKRLALDVDFYIINHDGFGIISEQVIGMFDLIIVDEAAVYRNTTRIKYRRLKNWIAANPDTRVWLMTGTPTPNEPTDAWSLSQLIGNPFSPRTFGRFRDQVMYRSSMYTYLPRAGSLDTVKRVLQPAVRYTRGECLDLPDTLTSFRGVDLTEEQKLYHDKMMKTLVIEAAVETRTGVQITAVTEAVKLQKLVQIACIKYDTDVLTDRGWVPIHKVTEHHMVWDGLEWVKQGGAIYKGARSVVTLDGVSMTPDHKVWVGKWVAAQELINDSGFDRPEVRIPDSYMPSTTEGVEREDCPLDVPVQMWEHSVAAEPVSTQSGAGISAQLRMSPWQRDASHDQHATVLYLDRDARAVSKPSKQGLGQLWRTGDYCMRRVGEVLRDLLVRHGANIPTYTYAGPEGQQWPVLAGELPLGECPGTGEQSPHQRNIRYSSRTYDNSTSSPVIWSKGSHTPCTNTPLQMAPTAGVNDVYDLINCGPRSRFVVRGSTGKPMIVHNCGVAYNDKGENVELDCKPRVNATIELVEQVGGKVIIFVPLTGTLHMLHRELSKRWSVGVVNGKVTTTHRNIIFHNFQNASEPHILLAHPGTMAHGLTLTAAQTIIWYGPITSNEIYTQANGRIERIGKKFTSHVVHIAATKLEYAMYNRLKNKQRTQGLLLELIQAEMENNNA